MFRKSQHHQEGWEVQPGITQTCWAQLHQSNDGNQEEQLTTRRSKEPGVTRGAEKEERYNLEETNWKVRALLQRVEFQGQCAQLEQINLRRDLQYDRIPVQ